MSQILMEQLLAIESLEDDISSEDRFTAQIMAAVLESIREDGGIDCWQARLDALVSKAKANGKRWAKHQRRHQRDQMLLQGLT